jgi:hypothetical protein
MNLADPVGKSFSLGSRKGQIIGVVKDFHLGTLRSKIGPAVFVYGDFMRLAVRLDPRNTQDTIRRIESPPWARNRRSTSKPTAGPRRAPSARTR